jgi:hypothetical protein
MNYTAEELYEMRKARMTYSEIAKICGCSETWVRNVLRSFPKVFFVATCKRCGRDFTTDSLNMKYCSQKCLKNQTVEDTRIKRKLKPYKKEKVLMSAERYCERCGKAFVVPIYSKKRYCCSKCRNNSDSKGMFDEWKL